MKIKLPFLLSFIAVCLLIIIFGCGSQQNDNLTDGTSAAQNNTSQRQNNIDAVKPNMPNPRIVLWVHRNGLESIQYEVTGDSVNICGPLDHIQIIFEKSVEGNDISKLVTADGFDKLYFNEGGSPDTIGLGLGMTKGINTTLNISRDIIDASGRRLKDDIKVKINIPAEGAKAHYILEGIDGTYDMDEYMIQYKILTTQDKNFIIQFSKAVDRKSVEASIGKVLTGEGVTYQFEWIDDKDLRLRMQGLKPSKRPDGTHKDYVINVEDALDCDGNQISWNFDFFANKPNNLGYIDLDTRKTSVIHGFNDIPYMVYSNYYMDKYAFIYNSPAVKLFDIDENKIVRDISDKRELFGEWNTDWVDSRTRYTYDRENNQIYKYTTDKGIIETISLPFIKDGESFIMMKLSPDHQKLALIYRRWEQPDELYIISVDGRLLHKYEGEEVLGNGTIIGSSEDRNRIYFMTNYVSLIYSD